MNEFEFDLQKWIDLFPLDTVERPDRICGAITSPISVAVVEQLRKRLAKDRDLGPHSPTDIFVFGLGEPKRRDVTKVNGLPYRPRGKPWPLGKDGRSMTFLCQFRFTESLDIVGDLPGDVLLIFVTEQCLALGENQIHFEWYPLGMTDLVQVEDLPRPDWEFVTCYGVRHRSVDYLNAAEILADALKTVHSSEAIHPYVPLEIASWDATKIGGRVMWFEEQGGSDWNRKVASRLPGRFLCSLSVIQPVSDVIYPWVNQSEAHESTLHQEAKELYFGDGSIVHFVIDDMGTVRWHIQYS